MLLSDYTALLDQLRAAPARRGGIIAHPRATAISWADRTENYWKGCDTVSSGCAHCYMYSQAAQYGWDPTTVQRTKDPTFYQALRWPHDGAWVFPCSWSDFFHEGADAWRDDAWDVIRRTPWFRWLILTKRQERIEAHLPDDWGAGWPWVGLGVSVENQRWLGRVRDLATVPATMRFVSAEPLLGPVRFESVFYDENQPHLLADDRPDWVIVGGESGPDARPMHPQWVWDIRRACGMAGVAFHFKQHGEWIDVSQVPTDTPTHNIPIHTFEDGVQVARIGRQRAGHLWHGRTEPAMPAWPAWQAHATELRRRGLLDAPSGTP